MATIAIDEPFFREPRFRPPQVLGICRVERDNLLDWHRRELIPDASAGGRTNYLRQPIEGVKQTQSWKHTEAWARERRYRRRR